MAKISLKQKIIITLIFILLFVTFSFVAIFIGNISILNKKISNILYETILQEEKTQIKNNVIIEKQIITQLTKLQNIKDELRSDIDSLFALINRLYYNFKTDPNIKNIIIDIVKNTQKDCKSRYFFILDEKGNIISYPPYFQYSMPTNIFEINLPSKNELKKIIKLLKTKNEVFAYYKWIDPETSKTSPKIAFFKKFKPLNWIIGEGIYLNHVREHLLHKIKTLLNIRFGENFNGYFFAIDLKTKSILYHPLLPKIVDYSHNQTYQKILNKNGFLEYKFIYPENMQPVEKIAYVTTIKDLDIKIGSGKYFVSFEKYLKTTEKFAKDQIKNLLINYLFFTVIILIIIIVISNKILDNLITNPIKEIIEFTQEILSTQEFSKTINLKRNDEFKILAVSLNNFLNYIQSKLNFYNEILKRL